MDRAEFKWIGEPRYVGSQIRKTGGRTRGVARVIKALVTGWLATTSVSLVCHYLDYCADDGGSAEIRRAALWLLLFVGRLTWLHAIPHGGHQALFSGVADKNHGSYM